MEKESLRWKDIREVYIPPVNPLKQAEKIIIRDRTFIQKLEPVMVRQESELTELLQPIWDDGSEKTVLLETPSIQIEAYLTRVKNEEKICISKEVFIIGKELYKADYQIADNKTISRQHAQIEKREDGYYITDLNSSNHTYVDGKEISSEYRLEQGMAVKLSDEEFIFSIECEKL